MVNLLLALTSSRLLSPRVRMLVLRLAGVDIGLHNYIAHGVTIMGKNMHVGYRASINVGTIIDNRNAHVWIGDQVGIAIGVRIITSGHDYSDPSVRAGRGIHEPIRIESGAWVGSSVTILQGVTIGAGAIVAAGAVVTKDVPPNTIVAGIPARVVREMKS